MEIGIRNVVIDCNNPELMTTFWEALLGFEVKWSTPPIDFYCIPTAGGRVSSCRSCLSDQERKIGSI